LPDCSSFSDSISSSFGKNLKYFYRCYLGFTVPKSIVVLTGGIESTTLVALALSRGEEVVPIVHYAGNVSELEAATRVASFYKLSPPLIIDLSVQLNTARTSALSDGVSLPDYICTFLLANACHMALSLGCSKVYTGYEADQSFSQLEKFATEYPKRIREIDPSAFLVAIESPFAQMSKAEVVTFGASLGAPYQLSWSCSRSQKHHCGACSNCTKRKAAFVKAKVLDPTKYLA
jgi:7-cyano-7-deazaguanine synthase